MLVTSTFMWIPNLIFIILFQKLIQPLSFNFDVQMSSLMCDDYKKWYCIQTIILMLCFLTIVHK